MKVSQRLYTELEDKSSLGFYDFHNKTPISHRVFESLGPTDSTSLGSNKLRLTLISSKLESPFDHHRTTNRFKRFARLCTRSVATLNDILKVENSKEVSPEEVPPRKQKSKEPQEVPQNLHVVNPEPDDFKTKIRPDNTPSATIKTYNELNHENKSNQEMGTQDNMKTTLNSEIVTHLNGKFEEASRYYGKNNACYSMDDLLKNVEKDEKLFDDPRGKNNRFIDLKSKPTTLQSNNNVISVQQNDVAKLKAVKDLSGRRVIQLKNFSSFVGLKSIIAQINGGPLEKIVISPESATSAWRNRRIGYGLRNSDLEVWFLRCQDAESFMKFSLSGMFIINGFHYEPEWAPPHDLSLNQMTYHKPLEESIAETMEVTGARRCLIIKKSTNNRRPNVKQTTRHYPSPKSHLSEVDVEQIHQDFETFGKILEITPVISRRICLAIHYFDIESAISAKTCYDQADTLFHNKYKEWTIMYGKDITDKPCINI